MRGVYGKALHTDPVSAIYKVYLSGSSRFGDVIYSIFKGYPVLALYVNGLDDSVIIPISLSFHRL